MRATWKQDLASEFSKSDESCWIDAELNIIVFGDGLGSSRNGGFAAALAVEIVTSHLTYAVEHQYTDTDLIDALHHSFTTASERIFQSGQSDPAYAGMGCSLLAAAIVGKTCYLAHVGDVRAYLFHGHKLAPMTIDDTAIAEMVKRGYMLPEKARSHSLKNILVKTVGTSEKVEANISKFPVRAGEVLMFCTDAVWSGVDDETMKNCFLTTSDPELLCNSLIRAARESGSQRSLAVAVVVVPE